MLTPNRFLIPNTVSKSIFLNGINAYATIPISPSVNGFCLRLRYASKRHVNFAFARIISWYASNKGLYINYNNANNIQLLMRDESSSVTITLYPTNASVIKPVFKDIVITYAPHNLKAYVDNVLYDTKDIVMGDANTNFRIGSESGVVGSHPSGYVDDFVFHNTTTPWTEDQISNLYYRNIIPSGAIRWTFDDTNLDVSGQNALTLNNTSYSSYVPPHMKPRTAV